jgi:hypothetical protein
LAVDQPAGWRGEPDRLADPGARAWQGLDSEAIELVVRAPLSQLKPRERRDFESATKHAMRSVARRYLLLQDEITELLR